MAKMKSAFSDKSSFLMSMALSTKHSLSAPVLPVGSWAHICTGRGGACADGEGKTDLGIYIVQYILNFKWHFSGSDTRADRKKMNGDVSFSELSMDSLRYQQAGERLRVLYEWCRQRLLSTMNSVSVLWKQLDWWKLLLFSSQLSSLPLSHMRHLEGQLCRILSYLLHCLFKNVMMLGATIPLQCSVIPDFLQLTCYKLSPMLCHTGFKLSIIYVQDKWNWIPIKIQEYYW